MSQPVTAPGHPWLPSHSSNLILSQTHFACPIILLSVYLAAFITKSVTNSKKLDDLKPPTPQIGPAGKPLPQTNSTAARHRSNRELLDFSPARKLFFIVLTSLVLLTYVGNAVIVVVHALANRKDEWWCGEAFIVYVVAMFFIHTLVFISLIDTQPSPSNAHVITWTVGLTLEIVCLAASWALYSKRHQEGKAFNPNGGKVQDGPTTWEVLEMLFVSLRVACLAMLALSYCVLVLLRSRTTPVSQQPDNDSIDERTSLLNSHSKRSPTIDGQSDDEQDPDIQAEEKAGWARPDKLPPKTWWEYIRGYSLFFPYLWPVGCPWLQFIVLVCFLLLVLGRVVNLLVPIAAGKVINALVSEGDRTPSIPWLQISLYLFSRLLQGKGGLIDSLRDSLWVPIGQFSFRGLSVAAFGHVHNLSIDFHSEKKTGEVVSALNKGSAINKFLENITFDVFPMLVDLVVAVGYFIYEFDIYYALIVALDSIAYVYITIRMATWRADLKREKTNLSRCEENLKTESLQSYENVKLFNAQEYEINRYRGVVNKYQSAEYTVDISYNLMTIAQVLCFTMGLMATCFLAAFQISIGQRQVGQFVAMLTLMAQLQNPLKAFGTFYRSTQSGLINSERMLELFKEQPTVVDSPSARKLSKCEGLVEFKDVHFAYDSRRPAADGLSFTCRKGTTTALVGESGGGKSTVFRLLFRFYNINDGRIKIDGNNIEDITIQSLRSHIGVVPQEPILFNESLMYNLKYANQDATDQQVYSACQAACIHERILELSDGYATQAGDRGIKLSGGEKQRIAIARAILKNPDIILLDEATAALDTETEQEIQKALQQISVGRTTIVIAHRLSTITQADQILVLHQGKVAERGTHEELLDKNGKYAQMWDRHVLAQKAVEKARKATRKAELLNQEAKGGDDSITLDSSANHSEDELRVSVNRRRAFSEAQKPRSGGEPDRELTGSLPKIRF